MDAAAIKRPGHMDARGHLETAVYAAARMENLFIQLIRDRGPVFNYVATRRYTIRLNRRGGNGSVPGPP